MKDLDSIFKFCTPKYVYIRDAKLGVMKYSAMVAILSYVVGYTILYSCSHLDPHHALGFGHIEMQHPVDACDDMDKDCMAAWHNIATLPYCTQYNGDHPFAPAEAKTATERRMSPQELERRMKEDKKDKQTIQHPEGHGKAADVEESGGDESVGKIITKPKTCRYMDRHRLSRGLLSDTPSEIFIPTRYTQIKQRANHNCYNPKNDDPSQLESGAKYRCKIPWETDWEKDYYVADIEQFTLKLQSSFNSPGAGEYGVSTGFQGIVAACPNNHPTAVKTECKRAKIPGSNGAVAPEDAANLVSAEELGAPSLKSNAKDATDEISLGDFLKLTPFAQNHPHSADHVLDAEMPSSFGHPGESLRDVGGTVLLDVNYMNNGYGRPGFPGLPESFQIKPITYRYRPYFAPAKHNVKYELLQDGDDSDSRIINIWYGISIKMQFNGEIVKFTFAKLLSALTTGLVLITSAATLVLYTATFLMPLAKTYSTMIYQISEDMTDYGEIRSKYTSGIGKFLNILGLCESQKWLDQEYTSGGGKICCSSVDASGKPTSINNADIIRMLCMMEVRLSRMDGNDTKMLGAGDAADENNHILKAWSSIKSEYKTDAIQRAAKD
jgi:hypothetical protein